MFVVHFSFECYPVAKVGGLGDVVGSLPKYLTRQGVETWVVMPAFENDWVKNNSFEIVHRGVTYMGSSRLQYEVIREEKNSLGFPLYMIRLPGFLDRPGVYLDPNTGYPYHDEFERFFGFQIAALDWIKTFEKWPDVMHCHDHHTALIPFMITSTYQFAGMEKIPTVLTIHNGEYHGDFDSGKSYAIPATIPGKDGFLYWNGRFNALSAGIRTCWKITTVSDSYMDELRHSSRGLEPLLQHESPKSGGIINGIDTEVWDPAKDPLIEHNYSVRNVKSAKQKNKEELCKQFDLNPELPLVSFIGRLAREKGADLLPDLFGTYLSKHTDLSFLVLGTGDPWIQDRLRSMSGAGSGFFDSSLQYNEKLSHQIYAGSDFLIMPSRVEPCGLNQMYALRYGTIPIVRSIGGLKDTVKDISEEDGYGIRFENFSLEDSFIALRRAREAWEDSKKFAEIRKKSMKLDFSWNSSSQKYIDMYNEMINQ